ncbi:MAG: hypothetical protein RTU30_08255 [Candidatus Thorarchaeota archaeon]
MMMQIPDFDLFGIFDFFGIFFTFFIVLFFVVFISVFVFAMKRMRNPGAYAAQMMREFTMELPAAFRPPGRTDGAEMKTVRLPERCPSCGGSLSHESIDWVGPMEAQCTYCGGTVKARFESI